MTVYTTCRQMVLHTHDCIDSLYWLIWICQCVHHFFLPCVWLPAHVYCVIMLAPCTDFFVSLVVGSQFCSPAINQISLSQSKGWFPFILKHFWPIGKLIWLDKNILHWGVETGLMDCFFMYYFLRGTWIVKIVKYFNPLVLSTCHNWDLLITHPPQTIIML